MEFYQTIRKEVKPLSIGYVTDIGFTEKNLETLVTLLKDVTLLVCECTFLKEKKSKARETFHLCSEDLNVLVRELNPRFLMPIHLSRTYLGSEEQLYRELDIPEDVRILKIPPRLTPPPILPPKIDREMC